MTTGEYDHDTPDRPAGIYNTIRDLMGEASPEFDELNQFTRERSLDSTELQEAANILERYSMPTPKSISLVYQTGEIDTRKGEDFAQTEAATIVIKHSLFTAIYGFYRDNEGRYSADKSIQPHEAPTPRDPEITSLISAVALELAANERIINSLGESIDFDLNNNPAPEPDINELRAIAELVEILGTPKKN